MSLICVGVSVSWVVKQIHDTIELDLVKKNNKERKKNRWIRLISGFNWKTKKKRSNSRDVFFYYKKCAYKFKSEKFYNIVRVISQYKR